MAKHVVHQGAGRRILVSLALLGACLLLPARSEAQRFAEIGGGVNVLPGAPSSDNYTNSYNFRLSVGKKVTPRVRFRLDLTAVRYTHRVQFFPPCVPPGCGPFYNTNVEGVTGLSVSSLFDVDPRGFLYVTGGAGLFDTFGSVGRLSPAVSAGVGVTIPTGTRMRVFIEARDYVMLSNGYQPPWAAPITMGVRF